MTQVLLVDDDYFNLNALEIKFRVKKILCDKAQSPEEALKLISTKVKSEKQNYKLIITDINMNSKMDGYQLVEQIKREYEDYPSYCIGLTGYINKDEIKRSIEVNMENLYEKPF